MSLVSYDSSDSDEEYEQQIPTKSTFNENLFQHARRVPKEMANDEKTKRKSEIYVDNKRYLNDDLKEDDTKPIKRTTQHIKDPVTLNEILPAPHYEKPILPKQSKRSDLEIEAVHDDTEINDDESSAVANLDDGAEKANVDSISLFNVSDPSKRTYERSAVNEPNYEPIFVKPQRKKTRINAESPKILDKTTSQPFNKVQDTEKVLSPETDIIEGRRKEKVRFIDVDMNQLPKVDAHEDTSVTPSIKSVAPGRHQLSSLVGMAVSQKESFETYFEQQRANKKASSKSYGF
ncbi:complexed with Cdc5 protein Cwf20 [Schizosaccharomyces cryophilus OY26]|uniref:Complexed with Cdc5 protein Cwf20 n=1 Tax=Schizosaccharomyces cryophilus (strain OY26 / ATCC MYA-4695 / CBS 11777 / NBRC 106824 / NRRL Y48691) TaxID=653667 RepID=S9X9Y7_SCHCR|nr:complexed with Cdc5 protein Cwf20 [Schizosaccharomyces cryophilus OY26]EPY50576.1 complexed with Cdc5 protein Cwf20 [Schizosaccharomyces cryophilus OY26]